MLNNKSILNYISFIFLITCFISCKKDKQKEDVKKEELKQEIIKLKEKKVNCNLDSLKPFTEFLIGIDEDTLHLRYDLIFNPVFKKTLDSPKSSFEEVKKIIACPNISSRKKGIAIVSMTKIDLDSRIDLLNHCYELYFNDKIKYSNLFDALAIDYYYYRENPIILNYKNEKLRTLLNKMVTDEKIDLSKNRYVLDILSGKRSRILKHRIKTNDYTDPKTRLDIPKE